MLLPCGVCIFPMLPTKINGKLLFALCKTCAETNQQIKCYHTDDERAFIGTWVSDKIMKQVIQLYKFMRFGTLIKTYSMTPLQRRAVYLPSTSTLPKN